MVMMIVGHNDNARNNKHLIIMLMRKGGSKEEEEDDDAIRWKKEYKEQKFSFSTPNITHFRLHHRSSSSHPSHLSAYCRCKRHDDKK